MTHHLINIPQSIYNYLENLTKNNETYKTIDIFI